MGRPEEAKVLPRLGGVRQVVSWTVGEREVLLKGNGVLAEAMDSAGKRLGSQLNPACTNCANLHIHVASDVSLHTAGHEFRAEATCQLVHGRLGSYRWNKWRGSGLPKILTCPDGVSGPLSKSGHLPELVRVPDLPGHAADAASYRGQEVTGIWLDEMADLPADVVAPNSEPVLTDTPQTPGGDW